MLGSVVRRHRNNNSLQLDSRLTRCLFLGCKDHMSCNLFGRGKVLFAVYGGLEDASFEIAGSQLDQVFDGAFDEIACQLQEASSQAATNLHVWVSFTVLISHIIVLSGKKEHLAIKYHPLCVIFRSLLRFATYDRLIAVFEADDRGQSCLPILEYDFSNVAHSQGAHVRVGGAHVYCQPELIICVSIIVLY